MGSYFTMAGFSGRICNAWRFFGSCSKGYTLSKHRGGKQKKPVEAVGSAGMAAVLGIPMADL